MKWLKVRGLSVNGGESGITLIELLVALAISGLIMAGVSMAFQQTITLTAKSNNHLQAVRQLQNAGQWISRDGQQAQPVNGVTIDINPVTPEVLILYWDYGDYNYQDSHTITYAINGTVLTRQEDIGTVAGTPIAIANNITGFEVDAGYSVTMTATVGGFQQSSETLIYYFKPRPS
jgi:prepilin-type N-terminal cleavage/methylation domain-containing protein